VCGAVGVASQCFWGRYEFGRDGCGEFQRVWFVVGDGDVEGVEEVGEVVRAVARERGALGRGPR
jgi:hypothetical protein